MGHNKDRTVTMQNGPLLSGAIATGGGGGACLHF